MSTTLKVGLLEQPRADMLDALRGTSLAEVSFHFARSDGDLAAVETLIIRDARASDQTIAAAERLRRVILLAGGAGTVDEPACRERGIELIVVPSLSDVSVAEHAVMLILTLFKRLTEASERMRGGHVLPGFEPELTTQEKYAFNWIGLEGYDALWGRTIGLVGLGRIGSHVARMLNAFDTKILYFQRTRRPEFEDVALNVRFAPLDELLARADCVSLHNRFDATTDQMMNARAFALMKRGARFVNTARGRLVDEAALVDALETGQLAGAALDVYEMEPLPSDSPLLRAPNLIMTPHVAGISYERAEREEWAEAGSRVTAAIRSMSTAAG